MLLTIRRSLIGVRKLSRNTDFKKDVLRILEELSEALVINGESSDSVVKSKIGEIFAILAEINASRIKREKVGILNILARSIGAKALIISNKVNTEKLLEDVVYERHGTPVVSPETLIKILEGEKIFIKKSKSHFVVKINPKKLREARIKSGMSVGALANELGVSKKSVYDYETKEIRVSVDIAAKLVELYGEDVLEPIDFSEFEGVIVSADPHTNIEEGLLAISDEAYHVPKGNVHVGGELNDIEFMVATPHSDKDNLEWFSELSTIVERKSVLVGFPDIPKEVEGAPVEVVRDLETFIALFKKGRKEWT